MSDHPLNLNRRGFLTGLASATVSSGVFAEDTPSTDNPEIIRISPPERPKTDLEAWNVGLITGYRPDLSAAENRIRNCELRAEIWSRFGVLHLRGQYLPSPEAEPIEEHAFLLFGGNDDSGNLKGFLRKIGRKFGQAGIIHKGYYRDTILHSLKDLPTLGLKDEESKSLGRFNPSRLVFYYALMSRGVAISNDSPAGLIDEAGGTWRDFGLWTVTSFFNRVSRPVLFDEKGKLKDS